MGTTSEELKKLYKKLGGKDPKVAGFSAPGEILNAINEIPLPTEYELPTVTTEDAGDVLVVNEEGKWDKGEAGTSVVPNPEGEATADLTKLGIDDTVYGIPSGGGVAVFEATSPGVSNNFTLSNGNKNADVLSALQSGKTVQIRVNIVAAENIVSTIYHWVTCWRRNNASSTVVESICVARSGPSVLFFGFSGECADDSNQFFKYTSN